MACDPLLLLCTHGGQGGGDGQGVGVGQICSEVGQGAQGSGIGHDFGTGHSAGGGHFNSGHFIPPRLGLNFERLFERYRI